MCGEGGCAWDMTRYGKTINEQAVGILLECILVYMLFKDRLTYELIYQVATF